MLTADRCFFLGIVLMFIGMLFILRAFSLAGRS